MMITEESRDLGQRLEAANGEELDRLYAESQLEGHRKVLRMLDEVLLPAVDSRELRTEVEDQRTAVLGHIEHAERLHEGQRNQPSNTASAPQAEDGARRDAP